MKRLLSIMLAVCLLAGTAACAPDQGSASGGNAGSSAPAAEGDSSAASGAEATPAATGEAPQYRGNPGELSVCLASSPETLDPQLNSSSDGGAYMVHMREGLYRYNWDGNGVEYGQAASHTVSDDGLVWTFTLRDDIKWSDGQPVVAEDFVYGMQRLVDPAVAAPYGVDMGQYMKNGSAIFEDGADMGTLGVKAIDEKTLEITLENPCAYFDEILAFATYLPVRKDMIEANGDRWTHGPDTYLTNGPFKMAEFNPDVSLVVVPDENYYDVSKIVPTKITFQFLADENAYLSAFQGGEILYAKQYPQEEKDMLDAMGVTNLLPQLGTYYLDFNNQSAPFDDPNVRKAFTLAIDRQFIAETALHGTVVPATAFVGPGFADADNSKEFRDVGGDIFAIDDYEANKEAAKQALADAGYPDGEGFPKAEFIYNTGTGHQTVAEACQNMWKEVLNVDVELTNQEWNVFQETRRAGNFEVARDGWLADFNDPMAMLTIFISGGGNNNAQYANPKFDETLNKSMSTTDRAERFQAMHDAENIMIAEDWSVCPIYYYAERSLSSPQLKDWVFIPVGYQLFHKASWA